MTYKRIFNTTAPDSVKEVLKEYPDIKFRPTKQGDGYVVEGPMRLKATMDMLVQLYDR